MSSSLARRQLRLLALEAIEAVTGVTVESPGDWNVAPKNAPNLKLRSSMDRKVSAAKSQPTFTTTTTLEILVTCVGATDVEAQDALEDVCWRVEDAVLGSVDLVALCQQIAGVTTNVEYSSDGAQHVARAQVSFDCETFEHFDPTEIEGAVYPPLTQVDVHLDFIRPFDKRGTYPPPEMGYPVAPPVRQAGPDGRDEGFLRIAPPQ